LGSSPDLVADRGRQAQVGLLGALVCLPHEFKGIRSHLERLLHPVRPTVMASPSYLHVGEALTHMAAGLP